MLDHIAGGNQTYAVFNFVSRQKGSETYTLKNSAGKVVGEYAPMNAFTYLIVAGSEIIPDDYTFWQGTTQLSGSKTQNIGGGMPQGQRPQMPNGEQGTPPEMPEGMERPEKPNGEFPQGERPEMPNGEFPQGERPEMPNGEMPKGMTPPDNEGGMMGGNMIPSEESSIIFTITKGGNQFSNVAQVAS